MKLKIEGIDVDFPYQPYPIQERFMASSSFPFSRSKLRQLPRIVIRALNGKQNAILQSPTGTGKTLCLLSASIAWVMNHYMKSEKKISIIYMSRTHTQLKQVINELKKLSYRPKTTIVGSRDHFCINGTISGLSVRASLF